VRHNAADAPRGVHLTPKPPTCFPAGVFPLRTGQPHRHQRQTLRTIPACGVVGAACHQRDHCLEVGTGIAERTLDARFRHDRPMGHNRTHIQSRTACPYASTGQPRQIRIQTRTGAARLIRMRHGGSRRPRRRTRPAVTTKRSRRNGIRKNQELYRQPCQFASIVFVAVEWRGRRQSPGGGVVLPADPRRRPSRSSTPDHTSRFNLVNQRRRTWIMAGPNRN
jgi:hypothetical protein